MLGELIGKMDVKHSAPGTWAMPMLPTVVTSTVYTDAGFFGKEPRASAGTASSRPPVTTGAAFCVASDSGSGVEASFTWVDGCKSQASVLPARRPAVTPGAHQNAALA